MNNPYVQLVPLYTPFLYLHYNIYAYLLPLYMYIHHISTVYTPNTPLNAPYTTHIHIRLDTTFSGAQFTFRSADDRVLDELATHHPDVHAMFPCYLSHRSAVDKDFMTTGRADSQAYCCVREALCGLWEVRVRGYP